jgi:DNA-binding response OmpR family regulator
MPDERRQILWADDEIDLLRPHIKFLEQKGFTVTPVVSGEDALAALGRARFDVVLLDENMPGLGGLATLDAIKSRDESVPVILVTKNEEESLMEEAIGRHIRDYLTKPVNPSQVLMALKRVLESGRIQDTARTRDYVGDMQRWQGLDRRRFEWQEWVDLAVDVARWDVLFDELPEEQGLAQAHQDFRRSINSDFSRFIEAQYGGWVHGTIPRPPLSTDVVSQMVAPRLKRGERTALVVIDCLRLDQWLALEPLLAEHFEIEREHYCSILPTATPYSRNAIFSGLLPAELHTRHPDLWQETSGDERSKNRFERQLLELQLDRLKARPTRPIRYFKIYDSNEAQQARRQSSGLRVWGGWRWSTTPRYPGAWPFRERAAQSSPRRSRLPLGHEGAALRSPLRDLRVPGQQGRDRAHHRPWAVLARRASKVHGNRDTLTNLRYKFASTSLRSQGSSDPSRSQGLHAPDDGVNKNYILARVRTTSSSIPHASTSTSASSAARPSTAASRRGDGAAARDVTPRRS